MTTRVRYSHSPVSRRPARSRRRRFSGRFATLAAAALAFVSALPAHAQGNLFWDLNGFTAGSGGGSTPHGIWNATEVRWNLAADGTGVPLPWINNSVAYFSAGTNATGSYTITLAAGAIPTGGIKFQDGTVTFAGAGTLQFVTPSAGITPYLALGTLPVTFGPGIVLGGTAGLDLLGTGASSSTLTLNGTAAFSGPLTIDGATLQLGAAERLANSIPVLLTTTGTLALAGFNERIGGLSGSGQVTLGAGALWIDGAADAVFTGTISGSGEVRKDGAGTLTLTHAAGWTGGTRISGGTLALGASNLLPDTTSLVLDSQGTFAVGNYSERFAALNGTGTVTLSGGVLEVGTANPFTFDGKLSGDGWIYKWGTGVMTLTQESPFSGHYSVQGGVLRVAKDDLLDEPDVTLANGATLDLDGHFLRLNSVAAGGTVQLGGGTLQLSSFAAWAAEFVGPGTLVKTGPATAWVNGSFDLVSAIDVQQGGIYLHRNEVLHDALHVSVAAGATVELGSAQQTLGTLNAAGNVYLDTTSLILAGAGNSEVSGTISGTAGVTKRGAGTLTLLGAATYTGTTRIEQGAVRLGDTQRLPPGANVTLSAGARLELAGPPVGASQQLGSITGTGDVVAVGANDTIGLGMGVDAATFAGRLRGAGRFTKLGTGTLTLTGVSDATGGLAVADGVLRAGADFNLPAQTSGTVDLGSAGQLDLAGTRQRVHGLTLDGLLALGGGELVLTGAADFGGTIAGNGGVTKEGAAIDTLRGPLSYVGPTRVHEGTLRIGRSGPVDTAVQLDEGATLDIAGRTVEVKQLAGAGVVGCTDGQFAFGSGGGDSVFDGGFEGTGTARILKSGTGRFTLNGTSSVPALQIAAGTVASGGDERLADFSTLQLDAGATLDLTHYDETIAALAGPGTVALDRGTLTVGSGDATSDFDATVTGTGGFTKTGGGVVALRGSLLKAGGVAVTGGVLRLNADERIADSNKLTVAAGAAFDLAGFNETLAGVSGPGEILLPWASTLTLDSGNTASTFNAVLRHGGTLRKLGGGVLTFLGNSPDWMSVRVSAGTFALGAGDRFALVTALTVDSGATFDTAGFRQHFISAAGGGTLRIGAGGQLLLANGTFDGAIVGTGTLIKPGSGSVVLSAPQDFSGEVQINTGTLALTAPGTTSFGGTQVSAPGTLWLGAGVTLAGPVQTDGRINFGSGAPSATLSGAITGRGDFQGVATFTGSFAPGGSGVATTIGVFDGALKLAPSHTLQLELGGTTPGSGHDQVLCTGTLTLGGKLQVTLRDGFVPLPGQAFHLLQAGAWTGAFALLELPLLTAGQAWDATTLASNGQLRVVSGYGAWLLDYGLDPATNGAPGANPSGDGIPNLLKFLLGGNPLVAQTGLLPTSGVQFAGGTTTLVFTYERDIAASASLADEYVEFTTDLVTWQRAVPDTNGVKESIVSIERGRERVTTLIPLTGTRAFARLKTAL